MKVTGSSKLHFRLGNALWALKPCTPQDNKSIQSLFGADDPQFPYPKEADFFYFPFRHLSKTIVGAGTWKATDFSEGNVLKEAMGLLAGVPACKDHWQGDIIGVVGKTMWNDGYSLPNGTQIPAGIDAPFIIDSKLHPDLVRQLNSPSDKNPLQCASVSVYFDYVASHEFENEWMFERALGTIVNGEMVRRIVTKITGFNESSLVFKGADKFARKIDENGKIEKMPYSEASTIEEDKLYQLYKDTKEFYIYESLPVALNFGAAEPASATTDNQKVIDGLLAQIATFSENETALKAELKDLQNAKTEYDELKAKFLTCEGEFALLKTQAEVLTKEKATLQGVYSEAQSKIAGFQTQLIEAQNKIAELQKFVAPTQAILEAKREEAKRLYLIEVVAKGIESKPDDQVLNEISNADLSKVDLLLKIYGGRVAETFGVVCNDCGSHKVSYKSAVETSNLNDKTVKEIPVRIRDLFED